MGSVLERAACGGAGLIALALAASACGDDRPPVSTEGEVALGDQRAEGGGDDGPRLLPVGSACTRGQRAACKVIVGRHAHIVNCFVGVQHCVEGVWGPCAADDAGTEDP